MFLKFLYDFSESTQTSENTVKNMASLENSFWNVHLLQYDWFSIHLRVFELALYCSYLFLSRKYGFYGKVVIKINRHYFLEQFWLHSKIDQKVQKFSVYPLPPHMHSLPYYQHSPPEGTLVTSDEPILTYNSHHLCYV